MPKNRRRDDDDDDSSVIVIQSPRPAKRRRQADTVPAQRRAPQRELLEVLKTGVFAFFDPTDLLALSYTCKRVRRFLTADESARIWQRARKRLAGPTPPPCPASMSELAWTSLLFTMKCQQCWHATKRDVEFALRMRYCSKCQLQHVKSSQMLRQYRDVSEDVFRLVPYSWTAGKGVKSQYWWEPEIERVYSEIKALDARVASGDRGAAKERKAFVTKRMRYVQEVLNSVNQCVKWQTEFKAAQETAAAERNAELRRRVLDKFHERGYRRADVDALLADDDIRESSCSGRPWKTLFERISNEIDRQHGGAGPGALRSKIEALHEHYRKFLKKHVPGPHDWTTLIPFGDIVNMHPVRKRLRTTRHRDDDLAALAAEVPTLVKQWRRRVEKKLLALLPATAVADDSDEEEGPDPAERLQLATSVFLREGDVSTQTYPRTLLIPHLLDLEHGPLKYATPDGPWTLDGIKHDPLGVGVVRDFCRYARLDVKTATACQLDESSLRLQCKLCRDEWPLVLSWRQAITHLHAKHEGQRGSWGECADSVRRQVAKLEASMETWTCLLCPVGKRKKRTVEDVQRHIKDRHDERFPTKGEEYDRALNVPIPEPMTVVEVHAAKGERNKYCCRYCEHEAALVGVLAHLKAKHSIALTPLDQAQPRAPQGTRAEDSQRSPSGPGRAAKRAIVVDSSSDEERDLPPRKKRALSVDHNSSDDDTPYAQSPAKTPRFRSRSQSEWMYEPLPPDPVASVAPDEEVSSGSEESLEDVIMKSLSVLQVEGRPSRTAPEIARQRSPQAPPLIEDQDMRAGSPDAVDAAEAGREDGERFACKHCVRESDRLRRFTLDGLSSHMGFKHHIVEPELGVDYVVGNNQDLPAVRPWVTGLLYVCKLCDSPPPPSPWFRMDFHLLKSHKLLDVVALRDYDYLQLVVPNDARNESDHDGRQHADDALANEMGVTSTCQPIPGQKYVCIVCKSPPTRAARQHSQESLIAHLSSKHGIKKPLLHQDYDLADAKRPEPPPTTYLCQLCPTRTVIAQAGIEEHFQAIHALATPVRGVHYSADVAAPGPQLKGTSSGTPAWNSFVCTICLDGRLHHKFPTMVAHLADKHAITNPVQGQEYDYLHHRMKSFLDMQPPKAWICLSCQPSEQLFNKKGVQLHLDSKHGIVGPEADDHCRFLTHESLTVHRSSHKPATPAASSSSRASLKPTDFAPTSKDPYNMNRSSHQLTLAVSEQVSAALGTQMVTWGGFRGFVCTQCANGKLAILPFLIEHLVVVHGIKEPRFQEHFDTVRRRPDLFLRGAKGHDQSRTWLCNRCGHFSILFSREAVYQHLAKKHQIDNPRATEDYQMVTSQKPVTRHP